MQPRWHEPKNTAEGELLQHVLQLEQIVKGRVAKNKNCMNCSDDSCPSCSKKASKAGQIKVTDADKHNNKVFNDIMGDGDEDEAHKNYDKARENDRGVVKTGSYKSDRGQNGMPALKGRGGMLSNFDFSKNTDKGMPIGQGGQRMTQNEAMGGSKNDRMGAPYTVDPQARHMASRNTRYSENNERKDFDARGDSTIFRRRWKRHIRKNYTNTTTRCRTTLGFQHRRRWLKCASTQTRLDGRRHQTSLG